jgi:steroid 5-alpha reductase family enzyme
MEILNLLLRTSALIFIYMSFFHIISLLKRRTDIVDIAWGLGFIVIAIFSLLNQEPLTDRMIMVFILVLLWGTRLSLHIYSRNKGKKEDYRYQNFKDSWGKNFYTRSYFQIFLLQGLFMIIVSLPITFISTYSTKPINTLDLIGLVIWIGGFLIETIADIQLNNFIKLKKEGKTETRFADTGLWKYSRHPNYFGEITQWWGIGIIALSVSTGHISLIGPAFITYLIIFVSGIPLLEKKFKTDPEWEKYTSKTRKLLPLPKFK